MNAATPPLPCPFCGSAAAGRIDGAMPDRPFYVRCSRVGCPGYNTSQGHTDPDDAVLAWNRRVQPAPLPGGKVGDVIGFAKKDLIRGEMVVFHLDRTGVLTSDKMEFSVHSRALMLRPID